MPSDDRNDGISLLSATYAPYIPAPASAVELDLGCGTGYFAVELARRHPERRILAADVMLGRLRKTVSRLRRAGTLNVVPLRVEARMLVGKMLPDASLDRIHLLCPDPWPKGRHRGHRLLTSDFTARLHRVLKPEGIFHFSSDDANYCRAVEAVIASSELFAPAAPPADLEGVTSSFERRWLEQGRSVRHLFWKRLPLPPWKGGH